MANIVRDRDRGYRALLKRVTGAPSQVTVGIHEDEAARSPYKSGATIGEVAAAHELGLGVPQRSFLAGWADENEGQNREAMRRIGKAVIQGKLKSQAQGLERFGLRAAAGMKQRMRGGISPGLDPKTAERRKSGSATPLIDTGVLWSSITVQVDGKKDAKTVAKEAKREAKKTATAKRKARKLAEREAKKTRAARKRAFRKVTRATKKAAKKIVRRSARTATRTAKRFIRKARKLL